MNAVESSEAPPCLRDLLSILHLAFGQGAISDNSEIGPDEPSTGHIPPAGAWIIHGKTLADVFVQFWSNDRFVQGGDLSGVLRVSSSYHLPRALPCIFRVVSGQVLGRSRRISLSQL